MEYKKRFDFLFTEINKNLKFNSIEDYLETLQNIIDNLDYRFNQIKSSNLTNENKIRIIEEILKEDKRKLESYYLK